MRYTVLLFALMLTGCANSLETDTSSRALERKAGLIYVGMLFDQAEAKLKEFGARPAGFDWMLTAEASRKGLELHVYRLRSSVVMSLHSKPGKTGRLVDSISVSTYEPKSWESKIDPEYDKFMQSFESREEYDLEKQRR